MNAVVMSEAAAMYSFATTPLFHGDWGHIYYGLHDYTETLDNAQFHCSEDRAWHRLVPAKLGSNQIVDHRATFTVMFHLHRTNFERWVSSGIPRLELDRTTIINEELVGTHGHLVPEIFSSRTTSSSLFLIGRVWGGIAVLGVHLRLQRSMSHTNRFWLIEDELHHPKLAVNLSMLLLNLRMT